MQENENNADGFPAGSENWTRTQWQDYAEFTQEKNGLAADERARIEIQQERAASAPAPAVENLVGIDARVDEDEQAQADLAAVLSQSIDGRSLSQRQVNYARKSALAYEKEHPGLSEQWAEWGRQSAN